MWGIWFVTCKMTAATTSTKWHESHYSQRTIEKTHFLAFLWCSFGEEWAVLLKHCMTKALMVLETQQPRKCQSEILTSHTNKDGKCRHPQEWTKWKWALVRKVEGKWEGKEDGEILLRGGGIPKRGKEVEIVCLGISRGFLVEMEQGQMYFSVETG